MPGGTVQCPAAPCSTQQYHATLGSTTQCLAVPCSAQQHRAVPSSTAQCPAAPCSTQQYRAMLGSTMQCPAPSHTMPSSPPQCPAAPSHTMPGSLVQCLALSHGMPGSPQWCCAMPGTHPYPLQEEGWELYPAFPKVGGAGTWIWAAGAKRSHCPNLDAAERGWGASSTLWAQALYVLKPPSRHRRWRLSLGWGRKMGKKVALKRIFHRRDFPWA